MSNIVHLTGFPDSRERCVTIAQRWLTACSNGSCEYMLDVLEKFSDEQLAENCIALWGLDQPQGDENDITWFEANDANGDMLVRAFREVRAVLISRGRDV